MRKYVWMKIKLPQRKRKSLLILYYHSTTRVTHDELIRFHLKKKTCFPAQYSPENKNEDINPNVVKEELEV